MHHHVQYSIPLSTSIETWLDDKNRYFFQQNFSHHLLYFIIDYRDQILSVGIITATIYFARHYRNKLD